MEALGINLGFLGMQILLFIILFMVMKGYLYEPMLKALDERKARITKGLEDAREAAVARDSADAEAKKILDAARGEAATIRANATVQAEETAKAIEAKANEDAKATVDAAAAAAGEERDRVLSDMRGQISSLAIAAANKLVGEALDENRQRAIIADFFAKTPAGLSDMSGDKAVVTSALPLTADEQANVSKSLSAGDVEFKVDPAIMGGLIVRVGDQVVDNSVAGQMDALQASLN